MPRLILPLLASLSLSLAACASNSDNPAADRSDATERGVSERVPAELYPVMPAPAPTESDAPPPLPLDDNAMNDDNDIDPCNADAARSAIGKIATAEVVEQARVAANAEGARTLKPGQMVTMEFRAGRLNIDVDADNRITNVRCG